MQIIPHSAIITLIYIWAPKKGLNPFAAAAIVQYFLLHSFLLYSPPPSFWLGPLPMACD